MARKRRKLTESTASTADIAFLLLTFFLLTTTMDQNKGMPRRLPPMIEQDATPPIQINKRNILQVHVNSFDRLMVNGTPMEVILLRDDVKNFITNPTNDPNKPEKEMKNIENMGQMQVSKGVVSLQTDRGTSYRMYMAVQNEIMRAYNELRDDFAMSRFGLPYAELQEDAQKAVRDVYPLNISEAEPRDATKKK